MVRRLIRVVLALAIVTVTVFSETVASAAQGSPSGGSEGIGLLPPPTTTTTTSTNDGGTQSSSGGTRTGSAGNCAVYASASSFGVSCTDGQAQTISQMLNGDAAPRCWDDPLTAAQIKSYGYRSVPGQQYYLDTCFTDLDPGATPYAQSQLQIGQQIITLPVDTPTCPQPTKVTPLQQCRGTLTVNERLVVNAVLGTGVRIPSTIIATQPSTVVRTQVPTAFQDVATPARETDAIAVPGGSMYARLVHFSIYPYGAGTSPQIDCTGGYYTKISSAQAAAHPYDPSDACWYAYPQSSQGASAKNVYPFRAEADWTVYLNGTPFATFQKYDDLKLSVYDVQALDIAPSQP